MGPAGLLASVSLLFALVCTFSFLSKPSDNQSSSTNELSGHDESPTTAPAPASSALSSLAAGSGSGFGANADAGDGSLMPNDFSGGYNILLMYTTYNIPSGASALGNYLSSSSVAYSNSTTGTRMFIVSNYDGPAANDVWYTKAVKAFEWQNQVANGQSSPIAFPARYGHNTWYWDHYNGSTNGLLIVVAGMVNGSEANDVWYSTDLGVHWQTWGNGPFSPFYQGGMTSCGGLLVVIPCMTNGEYTTEVWSSLNYGQNWNLVTERGWFGPAAIGTNLACWYSYYHQVILINNGQGTVSIQYAPLFALEYWQDGYSSSPGVIYNDVEWWGGVYFVFNDTQFSGFDVGTPDTLYSCKNEQFQTSASGCLSDWDIVDINCPNPFGIIGPGGVICDEFYVSGYAYVDGVVYIINGYTGQIFNVTFWFEYFISGDQREARQKRLLEQRDFKRQQKQEYWYNLLDEAKRNQWSDEQTRKAYGDSLYGKPNENANALALANANPNANAKVNANSKRAPLKPWRHNFKEGSRRDNFPLPLDHQKEWRQKHGAEIRAKNENANKDLDRGEQLHVGPDKVEPNKDALTAQAEASAHQSESGEARVESNQEKQFQTLPWAQTQAQAQQSEQVQIQVKVEGENDMESQGLAQALSQQAKLAKLKANSKRSPSKEELDERQREDA